MRSIHPFRLAVGLVILLLAATALAGDLELGAQAPDFTLSDQAGVTHHLKDYAGKLVVLEWTNPQCPFVIRHTEAHTMKDLAARFAKKDVVWLAIDSSNFVTAASAAEWARQKGIEYPILLDPSGEVGRAYGARTTPHMFVISPEGKLLYNGAIDDDPRGKEEGALNYVDAALASALAGTPIEHASTKPYGCSVKYGEASKGKASR